MFPLISCCCSPWQGKGDFDAGHALAGVHNLVQIVEAFPHYNF